MTLQEEIDSRRSEIRSDDYAMSIGEWISLYKNKEIDIHPEFQRFYRWNDWQKSRLIESILLGIPIPPIFVSQRNDGVWDVVDGLQRLSTIFEFIGILRNEQGILEPPLKLEATKYLPSLDGITWGQDESVGEQRSLLTQKSLLEEEENKTFTSTQRLIIKRAKIHVSIILKESDENSKYELFQRLNTGGSSLSGQELRNCILVSLNQSMYYWMKSLSKDENFTSCVNLTDKALNEQYDVELVLRFLVFRTLDDTTLRKVGDIDEFLTEKMREIAVSKEFDREKEGRYFKETFELLAATTRENSFRKYDTNKSKFIGGFLVSSFEAIALGIGHNVGKLQVEHVESKIQQLWQSPEFTDSAGSGIRASSRIPKIIPFARKLFKSYE